MATRISLPGEALYAYDISVDAVHDAILAGKIIQLQRLFDGKRDRMVWINPKHITTFFEE